MKNLKQMTYEELKHQKELIVNAKAFSICDIDRRGFQQVIEGIENEIYRREMREMSVSRVSRALATLVGVLVILAIIWSQLGCQTVSGIGGDIKWTSDGYMEMIRKDK